MKEALDRQLARLRTRLAKTPLPRFFSWWGTELLACLPERWRKLLGGRSEALLIELGETDIVVSHESGNEIREFGRVALDAPAESQAAEIRLLRGRIENPGVRTIFCVPESRALTRNLTLPAAAEENLRQVLSFEMDRQTPFKAEQVYFDSRVNARDATARTLRVELVVLPRALLDAQLGTIAGGELEIDAVDVRAGDAAGGARRGVNLLPVERRAKAHDRRWMINAALAGLALILLVFNMSESLHNRAIAVETMQAEVEKAAVAAQQVLELRKTLQDSVEGANFLSEKKRKGPLVVAMLDDLAARLNDDTYLERLSIENNQIQLQGQSKEAASLISVLGESPFLANPKLEGQIQPDPRTGKDRFTISAEPLAVAVDYVPQRAPAVEAAAPESAPEPVESDEGKEDADGTP
ncbi:PilN domain-containing protein [Dokdonella sp.]|uniref:PilN domain-containing protein n=1 Tax=Dokdonella sp. TaxID=2291710 RepID=UPI003C3D7D35